MMNQICIIGHLTTEPNLHHTQFGDIVPFVDFTIECEADCADKHGHKETDVFRVRAWGNTAEFVKDHFQKGSPIAINGRLKGKEWTDKNGDHKHIACLIIAENVYERS